MPEMEKWVGKTLHTWHESKPGYGWISTISVEKTSRGRFYPDEEDYSKEIISWSSGSVRMPGGISGEVPEACVTQCSYWNEGQHLQTLIDTSHSKRHREQVVRGYLHQFIGLKLRTIEKDYKVGDIIEFNIKDTLYRFERVSRMTRDADYGAWKRIPASSIKKVDISTILDKEFYL